MWPVPGREGISQTGFESWRDIDGGLCGICRRGTADIGSYVGDRFNPQPCKSLRYTGFRSVSESALVCESMYRQDRIIFSGCFVVAGQLNKIRLRLLRGNVFIHNTASGLKQLFIEMLIETFYRYATVLHHSFEMFEIFKTST